MRESPGRAVASDAVGWFSDRRRADPQIIVGPRERANFGIAVTSGTLDTMALDRWPFAETRAYVAKILGLMNGAGDPLVGGDGAGLEVRLVE